jgi:hypothetical protein
MQLPTQLPTRLPTRLNTIEDYYLATGGGGRRTLEFRDYARRVQSAGGNVLAPYSINEYIAALKSNGLYSKLSSSAFLGGTTFEGAFVPLDGSMPALTNVNFTSTQHSPITGLQGDAATMIIDTNLNGNTLPQDSFALSVFVTEAMPSGTNNRAMIGRGTTAAGASQIIDQTSASELFLRSRSSSSDTVGTVARQAGFHGFSRINSTGFVARYAGTNFSVTRASDGRFDGSIYVFARGAANPIDRYNGRLLTYHVGTGLTEGEQELLDTLQTKLRDDIAAELA